MESNRWWALKSRNLAKFMAMTAIVSLIVIEFLNVPVDGTKKSLSMSISHSRIYALSQSQGLMDQLLFYRPFMRPMSMNPD